MLDVSQIPHAPLLAIRTFTHSMHLFPTCATVFHTCFLHNLWVHADRDLFERGF